LLVILLGLPSETVALTYAGLSILIFSGITLFYLISSEDVSLSQSNSDSSTVFIKHPHPQFLGENP